MNQVLQTKKRIQEILGQLSSINRETTILSVAVLPGVKKQEVVMFTDDAKVTLSSDAAFRLGKHLLDMSLIAKGVIPTLEELEEKGIYTK